jgi:hypothetical protein
MLTRNRRVARFLENARAEEVSRAEASPANTPYWLLWGAAIVASVLGAVAFMLWGINGASTLFDMIVALCT